MNTQPIGVFDSGLGGLSVWKELINLLPQESMFYFADSQHIPYGEKSKQDIIHFSFQITDFLLERGCKLIVVACNTATSAAIQALRQQYAVPFVGIEPAIKPAALQTKTGVIGVIATKSTLQGEKIKQTTYRYAQNITVIQQIGYGLVELIENGQINTTETEQLLRQYIQPMLEKKADQLVLGCTHYPFLIPLIEKITQNQMQVINPAIAVAQQTKKILLAQNIQNNVDTSPHYQFYTSGENLGLLEMFVDNIATLSLQPSFERHHWTV